MVSWNVLQALLKEYTDSMCIVANKATDSQIYMYVNFLSVKTGFGGIEAPNYKLLKVF